MGEAEEEGLRVKVMERVAERVEVEEEVVEGDNVNI